MQCYFLLIYSAIFLARESAKSIFSNIAARRPYLEKRTPKPLKTHKYLSMNSKQRLVKFWPWPHFPRYFCALALKVFSEQWGSCNLGQENPWALRTRASGALFSNNLIHMKPESLFTFTLFKLVTGSEKTTKATGTSLKHGASL